MMSTITLEMKKNIGYLTIKSPPANALSTTVFTDLAIQLDKIQNDDTIKVVVLHGDGRFFSAGADIKEFTSLQGASDYEALAKNGQNLFDRMEKYHIPIIAAIHGAALGGGLELAMACHIRIVSETAKLGLPEITLGILPGFAGTQRLPQLVGGANAYELILTGEPISGVEAHRIGLANKVVAEENVFSTAETLAGKISAKSRPAITRIMNLIPYAKAAGFEEGSNQEAKAFGEIFGSEDASEGILAFMEKRKPIFKDK